MEQYRETKKTTYVIGQELGVTYLLEGSFQKAGDSVRLDVHLIYAKKQSTKWGNEYNKNWKDNFAVQSEVAQTIAKELHITITPEEKQLIEKIPTTDLEAYDLYLKGLSYLRKNNVNDLKTALKYFELAVEKDPKFALAYVGKSTTWGGLIQFGDVQSGEAAPKAMAAVMRAIELDSTIAEAQCSLADLKLYEMWDWKGAESGFKKAFALNPNYADALASIVPAYEYDIFISYRQKDNKGDRWVSEFVDALKTELESTFKEEISVYFDINPHDGLLETYDVNASLKDKLKCLIFIPIISRTYCDSKSFAWEHEFKTFVEQASHDQFGLKVKLPGGNVANRILPVQIHDLTSEDKTLLEKELGGALRSIEFIYKEPGVDKPLAPGDNEKKNLNNTNYKIQIIKVAHAIKDIVLRLKTEPALGTSPPKEQLNDDKKEDSRKDVLDKGIIEQKSKKRIIVLLSVFLFIAGAFAINKIFRSQKTNSRHNS